jgi:hypothetical protein
MGDYEVLGFESLRNALPCIVSGNLVITKREKREGKKVASILILACAILIRSEQRGDGGGRISQL